MVDELDQAGHHSVETVGLQLLVNKDNEALGEGEDPLVHVVVGFGEIVRFDAELLARGALVRED